MSKILAVFGATGHQGSSVVKYVLNDSELSTQYKLRAITRDIKSEKAKQLKERVEVVQANVHDRASLQIALEGVHTVFAMTAPSTGPNVVGEEYQVAMTIASVAIEKGAQYIIFSTLPSVRDISNGKYTKVMGFDDKARAERDIRKLPIKSAFYAPGSFMENFQSQPFLAPRPRPDGSWVMTRHNSPKTKIPLIDATGDTGKFIGAILAEPDKYEGKKFCAATALYSMEEIAAIMSKATGKEIIYEQVSVEQFKQTLPPAAQFLAEAYSYGEEFGYYGPGTEEFVVWAAENARGRLSSFEDYLELHPIQLTRGNL